MRILYHCPEYNEPCGGIRQIYKHVDALSQAGRPAYVYYQHVRGYRVSWFPNATPITYDGPGPDDVILLPEVYGPGLSGMFPGVRKVVFNQGTYLTFQKYPLEGIEKTAYQHPEVVGAMTISEDGVRHLNYVFPGLPVTRVVGGVDTDLFKPALKKKRHKIAFMPRRGREVAQQVFCMLRARGVLDGVELTPIEGMDEAGVVRCLSETAVFMSTSTHEGYAYPPLEAMSSGCVVVGYDGFGNDYMHDGPGPARGVYPVPCGDVLAFAQALERVLTGVDCDAEGAAACDFVRRRYSLAHGRRSVLLCWEEISSWLK